MSWSTINSSWDPGEVKNVEHHVSSSVESQQENDLQPLDPGTRNPAASMSESEPFKKLQIGPRNPSSALDCPRAGPTTSSVVDFRRTTPDSLSVLDFPRARPTPDATQPIPEWPRGLHAELETDLLEPMPAHHKVKQGITNSQNFKKPSLEHYAPLGSITYLRASGTHPTAQWVEVDSFSHHLPTNHPLFCEVNTLLQSGWIRTFIGENNTDTDTCAETMRIYLLPDDVSQSFLHRDRRKARGSMIKILQQVDKSNEAWEGNAYWFQKPKRYKRKQAEDDSLFFIFNSLRSPRPDPTAISEDMTRDRIEGLLAGSLSIPGLKTKLYPYQQRSAAMMIQRESNPARILDPRVEALKGPTGCYIYLDRVARLAYATPCSYEEAKGGILAETMGYGKTLICLAVVLQTKGYLPEGPHGLFADIRSAHVIPSLAELAATTIGRYRVLWKPYFRVLSDQGEDYGRCVKLLEDTTGFYYEEPSTISISMTRSMNARRIAAKRKVHLISTTLIIVPTNLLSQWKHELSAHLETGCLHVTIIESDSQPFPEIPELKKCDVVLVSKPRFEMEMSRRSRSKSGNDSEHLFRSDNCHFLRLIVDEGHNFVSSGTTRTSRYLQALRFDRKWIVSGTPSGGLIGADVELAADETGTSPIVDGQPIDGVLERRKTDVALEQERKDIENLGNIAVNFLGVKPWANFRTGDDGAIWNRYMMPDNKGKRKAASLRSTLEGLVVRHQMPDIEMDLVLPPLHNRVVYLDPCFFDKLSLNLFVMVLTANAVTSERVDRDYIFHQANRAPLDKLFNNLRQSSFYLWTGFSIEEVESCMKVSRDYLLKQGTGASEEDRALLQSVIDMGLTLLSSAAWRDFTQRNEMGMYVENFPDREFFHHLPSKTIASHQYYHWRDSKKRPVLAYKSAIGSEIESSVQQLPGVDLTGTASAKLSYLLDRIMVLQEDEKILVFYEGDHIAFYIAETLDYINVQYLIYTNKLQQARRDEYVTKFRTDATVRVLLMDLRQAARGLHIATASRIFFVAPVWQPSIEAQAIKRAHRIGQTRPVYVETVVLKDTLEDHMMQRRKTMTSSEQRQASKSPLDDNTMNGVIKAAQFIPLSSEELLAEQNQMARLATPLPLYDFNGKLQRFRVLRNDRIVPLETIIGYGSRVSDSEILAERMTKLSHRPSEKRLVDNEPSAVNSTDERAKKKRTVTFADEVMND